MTKQTKTQAEINAMISARIMEEINFGFTVEKAIDTVCGEGTYAKIASDVYDKINGKAVV